jgi:hypothetical protein
VRLAGRPGRGIQIAEAEVQLTGRGGARRGQRGRHAAEAAGAHPAPGGGQGEIHTE